MARCTSARVPDSQTWPLCMNVPQSTPAAAMSRSASSRTMLADLPPSSSVTAFTVPDASCMMRRPTSVEPVNAVLSTMGLDASSSPTLPPGPGTTLTTPGGRSASWITRARSSAVTEVNDAGLMTQQLPAAIDGAIFHPAIRRGKFHGMTPVVTP